MRARAAYLILCVLVLSILFACQTTKNVSSDVVIPKLATVEEVIQWSEKNLYYKNVDPWDPAPKVEEVIKDGYGDCKGLASVVSILLDSVGKKNLIISIKMGGVWHMFNAYQENEKWRVVNNARLVKSTFADFDGIKSYFKVSRFENTSESYQAFRRWFNMEIYPTRGR